MSAPRPRNQWGRGGGAERASAVVVARGRGVCGGVRDGHAAWAGVVAGACGPSVASMASVFWRDFGRFRCDPLHFSGNFAQMPYVGCKPAVGRLFQGGRAVQNSLKYENMHLKYASNALGITSTRFGVNRRLPVCAGGKGRFADTPWKLREQSRSAGAGGRGDSRILNGGQSQICKREGRRGGGRAPVGGAGGGGVLRG